MIWTTEMERTPRGIYTAEFRVECIPKSSQANWLRASRKGNLVIAQGIRPSLFLP